MYRLEDVWVDGGEVQSNCYGSHRADLAEQLFDDGTFHGINLALGCSMCCAALVLCGTGSTATTLTRQCHLHDMLCASMRDCYLLLYTSGSNLPVKLDSLVECGMPSFDIVLAKEGSLLFDISVASSCRN
jgi:hypothetical protein